MVLLITTAVTGLFFLWFALACQQVVSNDSAYLYLTVVGGSALASATIPVSYELAVETSHPTAEGITSGVMATMSNVAMGIFLITPEIPNSGEYCAFLDAHRLFM
jgi:MFS transporter, FLVCR family, disrupted in renal carcinoma protein 2